jgi:iron complex outermembrane recepter protein
MPSREHLKMPVLGGLLKHNYTARASLGTMLASSVLFLLGAAQIACAQTESTDATSGSLADIVVTAEKRNETLTKTPVAVSVVTQDQLQEAGITDIKGLTAVAPGLQLGTVNYSNTVEVSIRGITNSDFNELGDQAVATYIDGVYIARTQGLLMGLFDLGQVEVLRGPQGTLYGLNSTGGNVNINTADPKNVFAANLDISYGKFNDVLTHGMVNIPINDTLALRASVVSHQSTGYFDTEGTSDRNYAADQDYGARITALWTPIDIFKWRLSVDDFKENGTPGLDIATDATGRPLDGQPVYNRQVNDYAQPALHISNFMIRSNISLELNKEFSLTYIAGYQNVVSYSQGDNDGGDLQIFDSVGHYDHSKSSSHELDLHYDSDHIQNILGATYFVHNMYSHGAFDFYPIDLGFSSQDFPHNEAWGVFDQGTFAITDRFRLIDGLRYTRQAKSTENSAQFLCPPGTSPSVMYNMTPNPGCTFTARPNGNASFTNTSWKTGAQYDLTDRVSSYLTWTTGFKAGGLNPGSTLSTFKPENVSNFELGVKGHFFDDRVSLNTDVFLEHYKDMQVSQIILTAGGANAAVTTNAARSTLYGLEEEGEWRITPHDSLTGYFAYLHSTFAKYNDATDNFTGVTYPSLAGHYLPYSPKYSARLRYQHDFQLPGGATLSPIASVYGQTKMYFREFNLPIDTVGDYTKTDLSLKYEDKSAHWSVEGYSTNLEDRAVRNHAYTVASYYFSDYAPPREFGLRVAYTY